MARQTPDWRPRPGPRDGLSDRHTSCAPFGDTNGDRLRQPAVSISFATGGSMFRKLHEPQGETLTVLVDGVPVIAEANESVAAVLLRQASVWSRTTPVSGAARAPFCMMGVCFDCLAAIDGVASIQTCLTVVRDGMRIDRQHGRPGAAS